MDSGRYVSSSNYSRNTGKNCFFKSFDVTVHCSGGSQKKILYAIYEISPEIMSSTYLASCLDLFQF